MRTDKNMYRMQGQLLATARSVYSMYTKGDARHDGFDDAVRELKRLMHNEIGRHDIGDPVQLSLLILFMAGEQREFS